MKSVQSVTNESEGFLSTIEPALRGLSGPSERNAVQNDEKGGVLNKTIAFTPEERAVIEESFAPFIQTVNLIIRLRGLRSETARLADDRSGLILINPSS
jgi:hypothetical protein